MKEELKYRTFTDHYDFDWRRGKALEDFVNFFNKNNYEIIKIIERQQYVANAGNGTKYYDLDVIYKETKHARKKNH